VRKVDKQINPAEIKRIYNALEDEISRNIYKHRVLYSLLGDETENTKMIYEYPPAQTLLNVPKLCFYGAGGRAAELLKVDYEKKIPFVIDTYKTGIIEGRPILSLEEFLTLPDYREYRILITVIQAKVHQEIQEKLSRCGLQYLVAYFGEQYFDLPELHLQNEYFVDAGAFDGGTSRYFLDHFRGGYTYTFEANTGQFDTIKELLSGYRAELFPYGVYDKDGTVRFMVDGENVPGSKVSESFGELMEVRRLDTVLGDRKVTYIKMDIEGSELAALRGAERIIREQRPKLAICVYHKPEDMWEIPGLILRYHPDYKLYLRHYSLYNTETVLYAV